MMMALRRHHKGAFVAAWFFLLGSSIFAVETTAFLNNIFAVHHGAGPETPATTALPGVLRVDGDDGTCGYEVSRRQHERMTGQEEQQQQPFAEPWARQQPVPFRSQQRNDGPMSRPRQQDTGIRFHDPTNRNVNPAQPFMAEPLTNKKESSIVRSREDSQNGQPRNQRDQRTKIEQQMVSQPHLNDLGVLTMLQPDNHLDGWRSTPALSQQEQFTVQGGSLRTFTKPRDYRRSPSKTTQEVTLKSSSGRPVSAQAEVWQGPNYASQTFRGYTQNGLTNPWSISFESRGQQESVLSVQNTAPLEYPVETQVKDHAIPDRLDDHDDYDMQKLQGHHPMRFQTLTQRPRIQRRPDVMQPHDGFSFLDNPTYARKESVSTHAVIQGGDLEYFPVSPHGPQMEIVLTSEGLPVTAKIELWQGPGNIQQLGQAYSDNGHTKPFRAIIDTPSCSGNLCISNTGPMEYPVTVSVRPLPS